MIIQKFLRFCGVAKLSITTYCIFARYSWLQLASVGENLYTNVLNTYLPSFQSAFYWSSVFQTNHKHVVCILNFTNPILSIRAAILKQYLLLMDALIRQTLPKTRETRSNAALQKTCWRCDFGRSRPKVTKMAGGFRISVLIMASFAQIKASGFRIQGFPLFRSMNYYKM